MDASTRMTCSEKFSALSKLTLSLWLLGSLALAAVPASSGPLPQGGPGEGGFQEEELGARSPRAEVFFCTTSGVECRTSINEFDVDQVRDLYIFVAWRGVRGLHTQQLRLLLPDGNLYQTLETPFTTRRHRLPSPEGHQGQDLNFAVPTQTRSSSLQARLGRPSRGEVAAELTSLPTSTQRIPLPPEVQLARRSRGETTVMSVLPVAGTFITQRSLLGTWTVEVSLDSRPVTKANFTLRPPEP